MNVLDEWTEQTIGFHKWRKRVCPQTAYGRVAMSARLPYLPGEDARFQQDREDRERLEGVWQELWPVLHKLPFVEESFGLLAREAVLTVEQLALLQRFICYMNSLDTRLLRHGAIPSFWDTNGLVQLSRAMGIVLKEAEQSEAEIVWPQTPEEWEAASGFSLAAVGGEDLQIGWAKLQGIRRRKQEEEHAFTRQLGAAYRTVVRKDQTIILSIDARELEMARTDARLQLRMETPFEVVWEPLWPDRIKQLRSEEEQAELAVSLIEQQVLTQIAETLHPYAAVIEQCCRSAGTLDDCVARLQFAKEMSCSWTEPGDVVVMENCIHPDVIPCTPITLVLEQTVTVIMGPNMGGKSLVQKTLLFLQACHQWGLPIPGALSVYKAPFFSALRYVGGDAQSLRAGLSSFGAEMVQLQSALSVRKALLCLDELGRSTNPSEGFALLRALVCHLRDQHDGSAGAAVVATHFPIAESGLQYLQVSGIRQEVEELPADMSLQERLNWLSEAMEYRLIPARPGVVPQVALRIAEWLGLDSGLVAQARERLYQDL